jgi:two-component system nitrate/nitrite response regulator NarL
MSQHADKLTDRERQILALVSAGLRNREIGMALSIAEATVENHLHHIFGKLGVNNRVQAAFHIVPSNRSSQPEDEGNPS